MELNLALWRSGSRSSILNPPTLIHNACTHSDDVITTANKRQIKISPILLYDLFMALPLNIVTANISGSKVYVIH